jgi:hypothetical protein
VPMSVSDPLARRQSHTPGSRCVFGGKAEAPHAVVRLANRLCRLSVTNRAHLATCTESGGSPPEGQLGSVKSENQEKCLVDPAPLVKRQVANLLSQGPRVDRADHLAENAC